MLKFIRETGDAVGVKDTSVNGNFVHLRAVSQNDTFPEDVKGCVTELTIDFTDVPIAEVYKQAAEHMLITWRRKFKTCENPEQSYNETILGSDLLPKAKKSRKEKLAQLMANLSEDEKAEILEQLTS